MRIFTTILLSLLGMLLLAGCGAAAPAVVAPQTEQDFLPLAESAPQEELAGEPAAAEPEPVDECVACHTDRDRLTSTADPEEPAESESSGVG